MRSCEVDVLVAISVPSCFLAPAFLESSALRGRCCDGCQTQKAPMATAIGNASNTQNSHSLRKA